jgi:mitogen-activated protein kinase 7
MAAALKPLLTRLRRFLQNAILSIRNMAHSRHTLFKIMNQEFWVDSKFRVTRELGQGAYGLVWYSPPSNSPRRFTIRSAVLCSVANVLSDSAAKAIDSGDSVAVKKVTNIFSKRILTKRALRELKLLEHFRGHKNVHPPPINGLTS